MRKLPLDTSVFAQLRNLNYLYVDKTEYIYRMLTGGHRFFLSRPRRFGKSLLVSTIKEVLSNNKKLFNGLWITQSDYEWKEYGVINLDFSKLDTQTLEIFDDSLNRSLFLIASHYRIDIDPTTKSASNILEVIVLNLYERFGRVSILVDEYDSPILKTLDNEELAKTIRKTIQQFFTTIKSLGEQVTFAFITGVTSFAKAGLFSGINNLQILTLRDEYAGICGYNEQEIDLYFHDYINEWAEKEKKTYDQLHQEIKDWYNGYRFGEDVESVYNPFSFMNALHIKKFKNFWFQSGTPTFLVEILKKNHHLFDPEKMTATEDSLGIFDVALTPLITLMFQAGYLTITSYNFRSRSYTLNYPNEEVRISFQKYLLEVFAHIEASHAAQLSSDLHEAFEHKNIEHVILLLRQLFAHVPYQLHIPAESYYHSLFMMICVGAGIKAQSEYSTSYARIDLVLEFEKTIYVIEVKFNDAAKNALKQIKERRSYERFINQEKEIILLGLAFKRKPKTFDIEYTIKYLQ